MSHKIFVKPGMCSALKIMLSERRTNISGGKICIILGCFDVCLFIMVTMARLSQCKMTVLFRKHADTCVSWIEIKNSNVLLFP